MTGTSLDFSLPQSPVQSSVPVILLRYVELTLLNDDSHLLLNIILLTIYHFSLLFPQFINCPCHYDLVFTAAYSFMYLQAGLTHSSSSVKTSVSGTWTAPPAGTGAIRFRWLGT